MVVNEVPRSGWVVETQRGVTIALDTEITPDLAAEGFARDVVRVIQQARRAAGLSVTDCITLTIGAPEDVLAAVRVHRDSWRARPSPRSRAWSSGSSPVSRARSATASRSRRS